MYSSFAFGEDFYFVLLAYFQLNNGFVRNVAIWTLWLFSELFCKVLGTCDCNCDCAFTALIILLKTL